MNGECGKGGWWVTQHYVRWVRKFKHECIRRGTSAESNRRYTMGSWLRTTCVYEYILMENVMILSRRLFVEDTTRKWEHMVRTGRAPHREKVYDAMRCGLPTQNKGKVKHTTHLLYTYIYVVYTRKVFGFAACKHIVRECKSMRRRLVCYYKWYTHIHIVYLILQWTIRHICAVHLQSLYMYICNIADSFTITIVRWWHIRTRTQSTTHTHTCHICAIYKNNCFTFMRRRCRRRLCANTPNLCNVAI